MSFYLLVQLVQVLLSVLAKLRVIYLVGVYDRDVLLRRFWLVSQIHSQIFPKILIPRVTESSRARIGTFLWDLCVQEKNLGLSLVLFTIFSRVIVIFVDFFVIEFLQIDLLQMHLDLTLESIFEIFVHLVDNLFLLDSGFVLIEAGLQAVFDSAVVPDEDEAHVH